jgi:hypothetical protein
MIQQEIQFFWPLTEQVSLDLDYTDCYKPPIYSNITGYNTSDTITYSLAPIMTGLQIRPTTVNIGYWGIGGDSLQIHREKRPSWLHRTFSKILIGWEWKDK